MTIVLTGGGSGGHITPILAVAQELKRQQPTAHIVYIGQIGDGLGDLPAKHPAIDKVYTVRAGKFRRYHGEGLKQLLDLKTGFLNLRDMVYLLIGLYQSYRLLGRLQPAIIFVKGGFVSVPVGLAAAARGIPYITHDSDAIPGLTNRILGRWARLHAVALPTAVYNYPADKTVSTGIPLQADFVMVTNTLQRKYREQIDIPDKARLLFVIGGGLGSQRVNNAVSEAVPHLLRQFKDLYVMQSVGRANQASAEATYKAQLSPTEQQRVQVYGYIEDVYKYSGAADVIITRAGATNLAEFALQAKACVVVPSPFLAGGHQLKNAAYLAEQGAAAVLDEAAMTDDPLRLAQLVSKLFHHPAEQRRLAAGLATFAKPHATRDIARLILAEAAA